METPSKVRERECVSRRGGALITTAKKIPNSILPPLSLFILFFSFLQGIKEIRLARRVLHQPIVQGLVALTLTSNIFILIRTTEPNLFPKNKVKLTKYTMDLKLLYVNNRPRPEPEYFRHPKSLLCAYNYFLKNLVSNQNIKTI